MAKNLDELMKESKEMAIRLDGSDYDRGKLEILEVTCPQLKTYQTF